MCEKASIVDYEALDREFNEKCREIKKLKQNILELEAEIDECHDMRQSPQHVYLHEAIMFNIEQLDAIDDQNWEEMLEIKTQAIKFAYNMLERLEIRISNNEQLKSFQNSSNPQILISPSDDSDNSSLEDERFTRKIENNVKFHARKVQGYRDISKYFQEKAVTRQRLKSEDAETQTEDEVLPEANEAEDDVVDEIPEEVKQRRRSSAKEIVKKLERSTSIEERFQQVTVKNTSVDILKYFQPQQTKIEKVESAPKQTEQFSEQVEQQQDLIQDDEIVSDYFQRHKSLDEMEDVDGKFEEAFAQLDLDEVTPKVSVRERVKRMNSTVGQSDKENEESTDLTETYIDENHNEEPTKPKLSVRERIKRMNEGKLEDNADEKVKNRIDQDEVANVQLEDLKKYFDKPCLPLVFK